MKQPRVALESFGGVGRESSLTATGAAGDKRALDEFEKTSLLRGSGGDGRALLHSDLRDARLRGSLFDAGSLRDQASRAAGESGHDLDGRVWRFQLWPAPFRRLSGR